MANRSGIKTGQGYFELFLDSRRLKAGLQGAASSLKQTGAAIRNIGLGIAAAGTAFTAPLFLAAKQFAAFGDAVQKTQGRTGVAVSALAELSFAAEQSGTDLAAVEKGFFGLSRSLFDLQLGSKQAADAYSALGISLADLQGLKPEDQMEKIADGLAGIEDASIRGAIAQRIFGRSGRQLLPLFAEGAAGMRALREEAKSLGLSLSQEGADAAAEFVDAQNRLFRSMKAVSIVAGQALAPTLSVIATRVSQAIAAVSKFVGENQDLVRTIFKVAAAVVAIGSVITGLGLSLQVAGLALGGIAGSFGVLFSIVSAAFGTITGLLAGILSPLGLIIVALAAAGAAFFAFTDAGKKTFDSLATSVESAYKSTRETFASIVAEVQRSIGAISTYLAAGQIGKAAQVLWLTVKLEFQRGINAINAAWQSWRAFFLDIFSNVATTMISVWTTTIGAILVGLEKVRNFWVNAQEELARLAEIATVSLIADPATKDDQIKDINYLYDRKKKAREEASKAEVDKIAKETQAKLDAIEQARKAQAEADAKNAQASTDATRANLEKTKSELIALLSEADEIKAEQKKKAAEVSKTVQAGASASADGVSGGGGFFSAAQAALTFGGSQADVPKRQLKEQEKSNRYLKQIADNSGLVFT